MVKLTPPKPLDRVATIIRSENASAGGPPAASAKPLASTKPYERPFDEIDAAAQGAFVDLHDDAALHHLDLDGDGHPKLMMRIWQGALNIIGQFDHDLRNFHRHVTADTLAHAPKTLQIFTAVTRGFPVVPTISHKAYTGLVADWASGADDTALNAFIYQAGWAYAQVQAHPNNYVLASDWRSVVKAFQENKVVVQLGVEGAFMFEASERNLPKLRAFFASPHNDLPANFPRPTDAELENKMTLMGYFARIGEQYVSLSHLVSSCFSGTDQWPAKGEGIDAHNHEGRALVLVANNKGVMIDLAHASRQAQLDVIDMVNKGEYTLPLITSHGLLKVTGAESDARVTATEALPAIQKSGGTFGIIGARVWLNEKHSFFAAIWHWIVCFFHPSADADKYIDTMIDQMDFIRARIGIDHVSLGLDGDGFVGLPFKDYAQMCDHLRARMAQRGYCAEEITKVFGGNWLHVLKRKQDVLEARARDGLDQNSVEDMLSPLNKYFPLPPPPKSGIRHGPIPKLHPGVLDTIR